ncbi:MAG TPA: VCBS repeat-containing protein, partial [Isosphaeraceae bacterium]
MGLRHRPELMILEERALLSGIVATGSGPGQLPVVHIYDAATGTPITQFQAFPASSRGGVQVAVGDVNGDGTQDIIAVENGAGVRPTAEVFDGTSGALLSTFPVAAAGYRGTVSISAGDVTGNGNADIVVSYGQGHPWVSVFSGADGTPLGSFLAYGASARGGVRVAVGAFNGDNHADIATVNAAGVPEVKVFDGATFSATTDFKASFYAPRGGASIAAGNITGGGTTDLVIAQASPQWAAAGAEVAVFPGASSSPLASFTIAGRGYSDGARVAAVDVGGTGNDNIALAPTSGGNAVVLNSFGIGRTVAGTPGVLYNVPFPGGGSLAATSSVTEPTSPPGFGGGAGGGVSAPALTPLQRLGYYDKSTGQFVAVTADDPKLKGKDVYVIAHGWSLGYSDWANAAVAKGQTLLWWDTFPTQLPTKTDPGYNYAISGGLPPASDFLLDGTTADGIVVNPTGLAQTLTTLDKNAVVLAYSWIDESATPDNLTDVGLAGYWTAQNGERLALGLSEALGTNFTGQ